MRYSISEYLDWEAYSSHIVNQKLKENSSLLQRSYFCSFGILIIFIGDINSVKYQSRLA